MPTPRLDMLTGTNLLYTKQYNLRIVHEVIRLFGPLSRAEVARRTALTGQTISNLTKELLDVGLIRQTERRQERRGAPAMALAINPDGAYAIGLDFNRDHLTGVLVDLAGAVRQRAHVELDAPTPRQALDLMVDMSDALVRRHGLVREQLCGVGIGIPGPMHQAATGRGYVVNPTAFPGWDRVPLADALRERLELPVFLENDATAATIGERWYGAGQQIATFFYLFLGSGLGGGMIVNGRPYEGFTGNAGEIGYLPSAPVGGSLGGSLGGEQASHAGLHFALPLLYERLRADGADARTPADLDRLYASRHPVLIDWIDTASDHLAGLVLAVEYLFDPEAIFFGGRLSDRMVRALMDRVARHLPARRVASKLTAPRHLLATAGSDAPALGVATLPIFELFSPAPQVLLKRDRARVAVGLSMPRA